jgi:hypothetical protein
MSSNKYRHTKNEALLVTVAESIGSTLGTIAAKASAVPDALSHTSFVQTAEREGKKFVRKSKTVARKLRKAASKNVSNKFTAARRRKLRGAATATKPVGRSVSRKTKAAGRVRHKK